MADEAVLEGLISIHAALQAGSREIHALYLRQDRTDPRAERLAERARAAGVPVQRVSLEVIEGYAHGQSHGGIVAVVGPRRFLPLEGLIAGKSLPCVVMLDGVEDPFNFGLAVRALYAAGVDGLVLRPRNWLSAAGTVARASGGAAELMPTAIAETPLAAAEVLRQRGLTIACAFRGRSISLYRAQLVVPLFLVIGGEKRGVSRAFLERTDLLLEIPYARPFVQSLGTASAAAVLAFEIMRQRNLVNRGR